MSKSCNVNHCDYWWNGTCTNPTPAQHCPKTQNQTLMGYDERGKP